MNEKPIEIVVCMGSSCFSRGNSENLAAIKNYLDENGLNESVRLTGSRCEGECLTGPIIRIGGELIQGVTPDAVPLLLSSLLREGSESDGCV